ncbi:putative reverse transcriptase domain-containing protein [Tanacetum coccineum]
MVKGVKVQAEHLKQNGNLYFKKNRLGAAIDAYTRLLCALKLRFIGLIGDWVRVEEDCRKAVAFELKIGWPSTHLTCRARAKELGVLEGVTWLHPVVKHDQKQTPQSKIKWAYAVDVGPAVQAKRRVVLKDIFNGNLMHCTTRGNIAHNFLWLKEGAIYSVKNFNVQSNKDEFRVMRFADFMLEFDGETTVRKAFVKTDSFILYPFQLVEIDALEPTNNKYLIDVAGYVTNVGRSTQQRTSSKTLYFYLANCRGQSIRMTLWGGFGDTLIEKRTRHVRMYPVVLTAVMVKLYNNRIYLSGTSSTLIVDDEQIHVLKRLKTDDSGVDLTKEIILTDNTAPKAGTRFMSSASSAVTYTSVYTDSEPGRVFWGADEEISDGGSPRVIVYGYDGLPMQPVAPLSPDYVPEPEHPPSPDYVPGPEHPPSYIEIPYVPDPEYPEYLVPSEDEAPMEDQPLPTDASPVALSPGYVPDFDPVEDPKEDSEEHADYPADGGDGDDEPSDDDSNDCTDDDKEEPFEDEEDDEEEEEHLAPADSSTIPVVDPVPSAGFPFDKQHRF